MAYSEWLEVYYQITPLGRSKAGKLKRLLDPRLWRPGAQMEVVDYLAKQPDRARSLEQIWKHIKQDITPKALLTRKGMLRDIEALKRKGWIKKVK